MREQTVIYSFPGADSPPLAEVGGKGLSLMLGSRAGLPVPPGFILSVDFFSPWLQELAATPAWVSFIKATDAELEKACTALKQTALRFSFTARQDQELKQAWGKYSPQALFAVRSSSPEEDLEGASFAGGYETVLGVSTPNLTGAIQRAFASCLDYRVVMYKRQNGLNITNPKIAVIIQEQIASEIAGVGFSLDPVTNNFDDAVFTANWGLGETVVAGTISPDVYIVNKVLFQIKNRTLGKKETSIWLAPQGRTEEKTNYRSQSLTLSDNQVIELTRLINQVETFYKKPIDIEWAYAKEKLYLLQARPITTYISLPPSMITAPGQRKRLYIDVTISLQGIYQPISIVGSSLFSALVRKVGKIVFFRDITRDINTAIPWVTPGRLYVNLSAAFQLVGKKAVADFTTIADELAAQAIANVDEQEYRSQANLLKLLPLGMLVQFPRLLFQVWRAKMQPERAHEKSQQRLQQLLLRMKAAAREETSLRVLSNRLLDDLIKDVVFNTVPLFVAAKSAFGQMKKIAGPQQQAAFGPLEIALPNNLTTQMGLALSRVARLLPASPTKPFLAAWEDFLQTYGHRGPMEIDIAAPRYHDNQQLLVQMLESMRSDLKDTSAEEIFQEHQNQSQQAYQKIYQKVKLVNPKQVKRFASLHRFYEIFGGYRETHKYYVAFATDLLRQRVLSLGQTLYKAGRLEAVEQVFDLTLEELDQAVADGSFNVGERARQNKKALDVLARAPQLPSVFNSRGLIIRPPVPPARPGQVSGTPISPGVVKGRIKVLHSPGEKPLLKGEILVARATDPGWTPLFVNAGAVILEIGGVLQHGALVAREYGLPCVAGVEQATELWKDGTLVEVDGSAGIIRLVTPQ